MTTPTDTTPDFSADAGAGLTNLSSRDLGIPLLAILQKGSPEVDKHGPEYVKGADTGLLYCKQSRLLLTPPLEVIPVGYRYLYVEWTPREEGGGLVATHAIPPAVTGKNEKGQDTLANGNVLVPTAYFMVQARVEGEWRLFVIGLSSTQLKKARQWLNQQTAIRLPGKTPGTKFMPPMYSHRWKLSTVPESNDYGSWMGWRIEVIGKVETVADYTLAKESFNALSTETLGALPAPDSTELAVK